MMLLYEFKLDPDILEVYLEQLQAAPKTIRTFVGKTVVNDVQLFLNKELSNSWYPEPRSQAVTFKFATDRSRRWFFGTNAGGRGIPYKRTGALVESIEIGWIEDDGVMTFTDTSGIGQWVYGNNQVPGHGDTGWRSPDQQIFDAVVRAQDLIIEGWFSIVDIKGLV